MEANRLLEFKKLILMCGAEVVEPIDRRKNHIVVRMSGIQKQKELMTAASASGWILVRIIRNGDMEFADNRSWKRYAIIALILCMAVVVICLIPFSPPRFEAPLIVTAGCILIFALL